MSVGSELGKRLLAIEQAVKALQRGPRLQFASVDVGDGTSVDLGRAVMDATSASFRLAEALKAIVRETDIVDGTLAIIRSDTAPAGATGDLWINPLTTILSRHDSGSWGVLPTQDLAPVVANAFAGLDSDDGRIDTFWQETEPAVFDIGDLWIKLPGRNGYVGTVDGWTSLVPQMATSDNYVEAGGGWGVLPNGNVQTDDLQVLNQLGATQINADQLFLGGVDAQETIDAKPSGTVFNAWRGAGAGNGVGGGGGAGPISNTLLRAWEFNASTLYAGHTYEIVIRSHFQRTVADDSFDVSLRYTTDGSEALVTSPILPGSVRRFAFPQNLDIFYAATIKIPTTANYRFAICCQRAVGTGTGAFYVGDTTRQFEVKVRDEGYHSINDYDALSQKLKADGSGSDNPPISTVTSTWNATSSATFWDNDDGFLWRVDTYGQPLNFMDQGYADSSQFHADQSLCMFNYSNIVSTLSTALSLISCKLRVTVKHRNASSGLDLQIATHNFSALPDGYDFDNTANITRNVAVRNDSAPGSTYVIDLGLTAGGQFKAGTRRGIGLVSPHGNKGANLAGGIYGVEGSTAQEPQLQITYTKSG